MPVPDKDELQTFIDDVLKDRLEIMSNAEDRRTWRIRTIGGLMVLLWVPTTCLVTLSFDSEIPFLYPLLVTAAFLVVYLPLRLRTQYRPRHFEYRRDILTPLIHFIDPRLRYDPDQSLPASLLEESQLFASPLPGFDGSHLIKGKLRDLELECGKVEVHRAPRGEAGGQGTSWKIREFSGLFLAAKVKGLPRAFTLIKPRLPEGEQEAQKDESSLAIERVELQIQDFHPHFDCLSSDPDAALEVLTPPVIAKLKEALNFWRTHRSTPGLTFLVAFSEDRVYLAISQPSLFQPTPDRPLTDTTNLHRSARNLCRVIDLVETIHHSGT